MKRLLTLTLVISLLLSTASYAGILTGIAQGYGGDDIDVDRFRLADDTSQQGLYGSRYRIEVSTTYSEPHDYSIEWGGTVFLRNDPKDYSKDIRDYSWLTGEASSSSMDYSDNGKWLTERYKKNWSVSTPGQIIPETDEINAIINKIWDKTSDKSKFNNITKDDLINRRYNFRITMESMVLVNLPAGTELNGKTWDSNDSVWVTYKEFYKIAELLKRDCAGDSDKLDDLYKKISPLYVLFIKPNRINGVDYEGNMAVSLYCEGKYEGWGWHEVKSSWDKSQATIGIIAIKSKDSPTDNRLRFT